MGVSLTRCRNSCISMVEQQRTLASTGISELGGNRPLFFRRGGLRVSLGMFKNTRAARTRPCTVPHISCCSVSSMPCSVLDWEQRRCVISAFVEARRESRAPEPLERFTLWCRWELLDQVLMLSISKRLGRRRLDESRLQPTFAFHEGKA